MHYKLYDFCRKQGSSVYITGEDRLKVLEASADFSRAGFFVHKDGNDIDDEVMIDIVITVDKPTYLTRKLGRTWNALLLLDSNYMHDLCPMCNMEMFCWDGVDIVDISPQDLSYNLADAHQQSEYHRIPFFEGFPELVPYQDSIYVFYAGASEPSYMRRPFVDCVDEIKNAFANGYQKIVFYAAEETLQPSSLLKTQRIAEYFDQGSNFPEFTFFFVTAGAGHLDTYNRLYHHYAYRVYVTPLSFNRFELHAHSYLRGADEELKYFLDRPYNTGKRHKKFTCFNRVPREHRQLALADLHRRNLLDQGFISFEKDDNRTLDEDIEHFKAILIDSGDFLKDHCDVTEHPLLTHADYLHDMLISLQDAYYSRLPLLLNRTAERDNPVTIEMDDMQYYDNSYFSIISETVFFSDETLQNDFNYDMAFFSEKIFKPFAAKHPFVLVGAHQSLSLLREMGYKTFHPYINEDYDEMLDDLSRFQAIMQEVDRLCKLTDAEWIELQKNIAPIIEHNYTQVHNYSKDLRYTKNILHRFIGNE